MIINASSVARIFSEVVMGGGKLLSEQGLLRAMETASCGYDHICLRDSLLGWWGIGGNLLQFSPSKRIAFAFQIVHPGLHCGETLPAFDVLAAALAIENEHERQGE